MPSGYSDRVVRRDLAGTWVRIRSVRSSRISVSAMSKSVGFCRDPPCQIGGFVENLPKCVVIGRGHSGLTTRARSRRAKRRERRSGTTTAPRRWLQRFRRRVAHRSLFCASHDREANLASVLEWRMNLHQLPTIFGPLIDGVHQRNEHSSIHDLIRPIRACNTRGTATRQQ